jgi:peroxiredoxin
MSEKRSLAVGDRAPLFTLPSSTGKPVDLADHLSRGPVVLAWYVFDFGRV